MKEMSERRAHLLMQRGSETLRRSTGSLFACIVMHPMRSARSCAAVMAMGSWKQPDERCYIEQPWAPSLGTKMAPGERTDQISCLSRGAGLRRFPCLFPPAPRAQNAPKTSCLCLLLRAVYGHFALVDLLQSRKFSPCGALPPAALRGLPPVALRGRPEAVGASCGPAFFQHA